MKDDLADALIPVFWARNHIPVLQERLLNWQRRYPYEVVAERNRRRHASLRRGRNFILSPSGRTTSQPLSARAAFVILPLLRLNSMRPFDD